MRYVIVGYGFLGSNIFDYLSKKNKVILINRSTVPLKIKKKSFKVFDNLNYSEYKKIIRNKDIIIFTSNPPDTNKIISRKEKNDFYKLFNDLFELAKEKKIKEFIFFSSTKIYKQNTYIDEFSKTDINSQYLRFKSYCEKKIINSKKSKVNFKIIRISNVFGLTKNYNKSFDTLLIPSMIKSSVKNKLIILNNPFIEKDFISINNFIIFFNKILKDKNIDSPKIYNLASFNSKTIINIAETIKKIFMSRYGIKISIKLRSKNINKIQINSKVFKSNIKFSELDFEKNLMKLIIFYKNKKYEK